MLHNSAPSVAPFAVVQIPIESPDWKPRNFTSVPPAQLGTVDVGLQAEFVLSFNRSEFARSHKRWALLLLDGGVLFLNNVTAERRPNDPTAFPSDAEGVSCPQAARKLASDRNAEIYRCARVPRFWHVPVRHVGCELGKGVAHVA